ncbi:MAG: hypothetical protein QNK37_04970 [Acidobacteriota bacterium]|nr:hypothetical protein [Acidobacteriota bacterium]
MYSRSTDFRPRYRKTVLQAYYADRGNGVGVLLPALPSETQRNNEEWNRLVEAGQEAGAGHDEESYADRLAGWIKFQLRDDSQTTYGVAIRNDGSHLLIAKQNYQGSSAETNRAMMMAAKQFISRNPLPGTGAFSMEVVSCSGVCLHAEMGLARYMGPEAGNYTYGASIGCCPLCMAYLASIGATFGKAGSIPLTGWQHPTSGETLAHP